jgi:acylphosphatase
MSPEKPVRCDVIFRGNVQGVGFRYTAIGVAKTCSVTGYVMNLRDGTVRMVAEGRKGDVTRLIQGVKAAMVGYIQEHAESWGPATGELFDFSVRHEGR